MSVGVACGVGVACLAACSRGDRAGAAARPLPVDAGAVVAGGEVWAVKGQSVAVPLGVGDGAARTVFVAGDQAGVWWVAREAAEGEGWLGVVRRWSAKVAGERGVGLTEEGASAWAVVPSESLKEGSGWLTVGSTRVRVRAVSVSDAASGAEPTIANRDGSLRSALGPALASPFTAWRARLALGEVGDAVGEFGSAESVLSVIDRTEGALWRGALARLSGLDARVAGAARHQLAGVVTFERGERLPVWVQDGETLLRLRAELLTDDLSDAQRVARAKAWLESQPPAAAWVCDDAGLRDAATGAPICTVMVANLTDAPLAASVVVEGTNVSSGGGAGPEMTMLEPGRAVKLHAGAGVGDTKSERAVIVRAGGWVKRLPVLCAEVDAKPPGLTIGPLVLDLANQLMKGASQAGVGRSAAAMEPSVDRATVGVLMCEPSKRLAHGEEWVLYLECMWPAGREAASDRVRVLLGPSSGGPSARVVVADRDGQTNDAVRVVRRADRWVCWVRIPAEAIERDGRARIGLVREVRTSAAKVPFRAAWPRPLLPIGIELDPGRLCVDLTAWNRLPSESAGEVRR